MGSEIVVKDNDHTMRSGGNDPLPGYFPRCRGLVFGAIRIVMGLIPI